MQAKLLQAKNKKKREAAAAEEAAATAVVAKEAEKVQVEAQAVAEVAQAVGLDGAAEFAALLQRSALDEANQDLATSCNRQSRAERGRRLTQIKRKIIN